MYLVLLALNSSPISLVAATKSTAFSFRVRMLPPSMLTSYIYIYIYIYRVKCGPGSSVGIATDYGLDGPGSNAGGDEIFRPSRPALGSTRPPVKWAPVFPGGKVRPGRAADHSPPSSAAVIGRVELYLYPPSGPNRACNGITLPFFCTSCKVQERSILNTCFSAVPSEQLRSEMYNMPART